jgi:hypothetical protein
LDGRIEADRQFVFGTANIWWLTSTRPWIDPGEKEEGNKKEMK